MELFEMYLLFTVIIFNMEHDHTWQNLSIYADADLD
jgi:hypothetical protein